MIKKTFVGIIRLICVILTAPLIVAWMVQDHFSNTDDDEKDPD